MGSTDRSHDVGSKQAIHDDILLDRHQSDEKVTVAPYADNVEAISNRTSERSLLWKQDLRILPLCALAYMLCILDRSNVGNAKILHLNTNRNFLVENNMSNLQFTIALMVFFVFYALFEIPSNILLKKFRPSRWIAFLMFSWGALTVGLGGTRSFATVAVVRILLGAFESGLFPGIVYYLTFWYTAKERSIRVAFIFAGSALAGAFGGAIAFGIGHMNAVQGLSAWRWLFILEGIPSCLSAILFLFILPDYPETTKWLSTEEKAFAAERLRIEGSKGSAKITWKDAKGTLTDWRLYGHYAIYFAFCVPFSSLSLFSPSITAGLNYKGLQAQLMTAPPYAIAYLVTLFVSWSADRFNARALHAAAFATVGAIGFIASAILPPDYYMSRYGCLIIATTGAFACTPPLIAWLSCNLHSTTAAAISIALTVSLGTPGQMTGVWIYKADEAKRGYPTGHWTNAALLLFVAGMAIGLRVYYARQNRRRLLTAAPGQEVRLFNY